MRLQFPALGEDLDDAFDNALSQGLMQRERPQDRTTFFASFELVASEVEDDQVIFDWFINKFTDQYIHVPRKDGSA